MTHVLGAFCVESAVLVLGGLWGQRGVPWVDGCGCPGRGVGLVGLPLCRAPSGKAAQLWRDQAVKVLGWQLHLALPAAHPALRGLVEVPLIVEDLKGLQLSSGAHQAVCWRGVQCVSDLGARCRCWRGCFRSIRLSGACHRTHALQLWGRFLEPTPVLWALLGQICIHGI